MPKSPASERREHPRLAVQAGVRFYHIASRREFPGRTTNLSSGGLWMYVPPDAPLRAGQGIRFLELPQSLGGATLPKLQLPLDAAILRVDREALAATGQIGIAVRFDPALP